MEAMLQTEIMVLFNHSDMPIFTLMGEKGNQIVLNQTTVSIFNYMCRRKKKAYSTYIYFFRFLLLIPIYQYMFAFVYCNSLL